jgi:apolipoprotein N-acyltransferase
MAVTLTQASHVIAGLSGWRRAAAAFGAGGLSALALPPFNAVPVLIVSFGVLLWLMDGTRRARLKRFHAIVRAFGIGWCFGFGQFLFGLYWISNALLVDAPSFAWAVPLSMAALPAGLALFPAFGLAIAGAVWPSGLGRTALLALVWVGAEWIRGHALTGFPWNLIGYVWTDLGPIAQGAALFGIYGLSLMTVLVMTVPATLVDAGGHFVRAKILVGFCAAAMAALWGWGSLRLADANLGAHSDVVVRVVQPNIPQHLKWRADRRRANFERLLDLTSAGGVDAVTHVIWPEAATPYYLEHNAPRREEIAVRLAPGQVLLTGALRTAFKPGDTRQYWNSLLGLDGSGHVIQAYNKSHLVPFGEYLPLRSVLGRLGFDKLTTGLGDYSVGVGRQTLEVPGVPPFSPLICYEVIFPGAVTAEGSRPSWLLNLTNDGWYGISTGPLQHFAMARMRAIEEGLPLVRSANTGISAVIDSYGRPVAKLGLGQGGIIDVPLPRAAPPPPYARWGDWMWVPLLLISVFFAWFWRRKN